MQAVKRALAGTYAGVCADGAEGLMGMGRLISDGAFYWYIVDVVGPSTSQKGLGTPIMTELEAMVSEWSTTGVANLVARPEVQPFYARLGYEGFGSQFMGKAVRS